MALQNNSRRIMPYSFLRRLPKSGDATTTGFTLLFSPEPCFLVTSSAWAINPGICPTVSNNFQRWNQRPEALWWSAIGTLKLAPKRVLRSWAARRLRVAFVESLRKCGYSQDGVRISVNKKNGVFHQPSLKGTVQIFANNPSLIKMRNHDLMKQMDFTVQLLIKKLTETGSKNSRNRFDYSGRHQGKVDAGVAVLLTEDKRLIEFPSILLPPNISSGSIVDITVSRNLFSEQKAQANFLALQDSIHSSFGVSQPAAPILRCRNATQTSVVLEWDPIQLATADIISLSLFRNGQKAGNIPRPYAMQSTKISGLGVDTEYTFHLVLRTTAGTYNSERVMVRTHKMTDLSGITITPGILPPQLRDSLTRAIERIGAKMADSVRIDTTHFVTTEGHGSAWEKAVEMNIPVVRPEWIEGCEAGGRIVGVRQYYLDADPKQRQMAPSEVSTQFQEPIKSSPLPLSPESGSGVGQSPILTPPIKDEKFSKDEKSNDNQESREDQVYTLQNQQSREKNLDNSNHNHQDHTPQASPRQNSIQSPPVDSSHEDEKKETKIRPVGDEWVLPETSSFQDVAL